MNQRFTEKQRKIANFIEQLTTNFSKYIDISMYRKEEAKQRSGRDGIVKTESFIDSYRRTVKIVLVEAENGNELDEWAEALVKAEEHLQQLENERLHELETPDFFKYVFLTNRKNIQ